MSKKAIYLLFAIACLTNLAFWTYARDLRAEWTNVPPAPEDGAGVMALGDDQLAYRSIGLMLQNIGDIGGRSTPLTEYDYEELKNWFFLADSLDPVSEFMPRLAAHYFGSSQDPEDLAHVVDYLEFAGQRTYGVKWHWLWHAVTMARHGMKDLDRAHEIALKLAAHPAEGLPAWTDMMPAIVLTAQGEKEMAYNLMISLLQSSAEEMHPNEVNHVLAYICEDILTPAEAKLDPLCAGR